MTAADPAARLQALADYFRAYGLRDDLLPPLDRALAEHVEGAIRRNEKFGAPYPTREADELLAVADAAGVTR